MKIKLITCYYGKFPEWIDLWLLSCRKNPLYDFLIVTDTKLENTPENVFVLRESFEKLQKRFSKAIGIDVVLESPYKLCDYKPVYGLAFQEHLRGYDFWGHCDIDLVWGNIETFITQEILLEYDMIGEYGHFILYRNNENMNNLFRKNGGTFNYKTVFSNKDNYSFDEMTGMDLIAKNNGINQYKNLKIANMSPLYERMKIASTQVCREFFCWIDGHIYRVYETNSGLKQEEYLYLHFSGKKPRNNIDHLNIDGFYINSNELQERNCSGFNMEELSIHNYYIDFNEDRKELKAKKRERMKRVINLSLHQKYILVRVHMALHRVRK